jgi:pyruvate/2-oxoglutarate dehydrogenase complex dihydrolipoamide acyltransferase (E2) component
MSMRKYAAPAAFWQRNLPCAPINFFGARKRLERVREGERHARGLRDDRVAMRKMMNLSSSFDQRVIDGAEAAEFIQRIRAAREHPATLFMP